MKRTVILMLVLFFTVISIADCGYKSVFTNNIKGPVKSMNYQTFKGIDKFGEIFLGEKEVSYMFTYNNDNQVTSVSLSPDSHHIIKYDGGCHVSTDNFDSDGNLMSRRIIKYNNNLLTESSYYYKDGTLLWRDSYEYNDKNELIKWLSYNIEGKLTNRVIYERDSHGNPIKTDQEDQYGANSLTLSEYNEDGYLTAMTRINRNNDTVNNMTYLYFDFDEYNNWTKMHTFSNNVIQKIIVRVFEYY